MRTSSLVLTLLLACAPLQAQEAPLELGVRVHELPGAVENHLDARAWRLDSAVFTEIRPFTVPDIAIALPQDQREEPSVDNTTPLPPAPRPESEQ